MVEEHSWKAGAERVILPYLKLIMAASAFLSTTEHLKFCGNLGGPSSKPKYYPVTDSELVP